MINTIKLGELDLDDNKVQAMLKKQVELDHLIIFPTETVYGIGGNALSSQSANNIFSAKGRPQDNPLIVHIPKKEDASLYATNISKHAQMLMASFWPGPLTMIFDKKDIIPYETTGGLETVAIRVPNHTLALKLLNIINKPLAAPSANLSGKPSSTMFKHVLNDFDGKVDVIIDGGKSLIGLESTVIDMTKTIPVILRPGAITKKMIESVLGISIEDQSSERITEKVKSPGMKYTHYKPQGEVYLLNGSIEKVAEYLNQNKKDRLGKRSALICASDYKDQVEDVVIYTLGALNDINDIASNIFSTLRQMDDDHINLIYIHAVSDENIGYAVMNRLLKASGYNRIDLD
ncbi:MAG TPA: L-threonylcarbamoyladenylate synthase [Acholeplasma sp.]|nr:L-threonylcarbamoyladenylate synthase [Acholeplasma sp.]